MRTMTPKQQKAFVFIKTYIKNRGEGPTQQEIADHMGYNNKSEAQQVLSQLQGRGLINKDYGVERGITLVEDL